MISMITLGFSLLSMSHAVQAAKATYEIQFKNHWNKADHVAFPDNAHFSPIVAVAHTEKFQLFSLGNLATPGFEDLAELGRTGKILTEIEAAMKKGKISTVQVSEALYPKRDGNDLSMRITVTADHDLISFASMIAPSPDWIVGVDALDTFKDGKFIDAAEFELFAINGGTEEGDFAGNFSISNSPTEPREPISTLDHIPGLTEAFASVKIVKIK